MCDPKSGKTQQVVVLWFARLSLSRWWEEEEKKEKGGGEWSGGEGRRGTSFMLGDTYHEAIVVPTENAQVENTERGDYRNSS